MTVIVESKRLKVTQALRAYIEEQADKLAKLGKGITQVRVHLEKIAKKTNDPHANVVTFHVSIPGKDVVVTKRAVDMYEAIVEATEGAVRQLRKQHEKRRTLRRSHSNKALT